MEPVSEAEQLSSTSERWEKVVDTLRVGTWCRAGSLALGVRPEPRPEHGNMSSGSETRISERESRIGDYF